MRRNCGGRWRRLGGELSRSGGAGDTLEDVAAFPNIPIAEVSAYPDAVRAEALNVVDALSEAELGKRFLDRDPGFGQPPPVVA